MTLITFTNLEGDDGQFTAGWIDVDEITLEKFEWVKAYRRTHGPDKRIVIKVPTTRKAVEIVMRWKRLGKPWVYSFNHSIVGYRTPTEDDLDSSPFIKIESSELSDYDFLLQTQHSEYYLHVQRLVEANNDPKSKVRIPVFGPRNIKRIYISYYHCYGHSDEYGWMQLYEPDNNRYRRVKLTSRKTIPIEAFTLADFLQENEFLENNFDKWLDQEGETGVLEKPVGCLNLFDIYSANYSQLLKAPVPIQEHVVNSAVDKIKDLPTAQKFQAFSTTHSEVHRFVWEIVDRDLLIDVIGAPIKMQSFLKKCQYHSIGNYFNRGKPKKIEDNELVSIEREIVNIRNSRYIDSERIAILQNKFAERMNLLKSGKAMAIPVKKDPFAF